MEQTEPTKLSELYTELPTWQRRFTLGLSVFLVTVFLAAAVSAGIFFAIGEPQMAIPFANVASSLATVVLVGITFWYAFETRRLVRITENRHQEERHTEERQKIEQRNVLRRALAQEIGKRAYIDDLADKYTANYSRFESLIPKTVYEANADEIGNLTEEEVDVVVEFYSRADYVEDLMKIQREEDTLVNQDFLTEYFDTTERLLNSLVRKLSLGHIDPSDRKYRTENIRENLRELADNQERAIEILEENIDPIEE